MALRVAMSYFETKFCNQPTKEIPMNLSVSRATLTLVLLTNLSAGAQSLNKLPLLMKDQLVTKSARTESVLSQVSKADLKNKQFKRTQESTLLQKPMGGVAT